MNTVMQKATWIAVDWGSSWVRVWVVNARGDILDFDQSQRGCNTLQPNDYEPVLLDLIAKWLEGDTVLPIVICGMAGSRQGWQEADYLAVPLQWPSQVSAMPVATQDSRIKVYILPGLKQLNPPDVMRGEETQLAGLLTQQPDFNGVVVLPGTHSKWVRLQNHTIESFHTCMTGELFQLLSEQSMLRHCMNTKEWSQQAFDSAFLQALSQPSLFSATLFSLRAEFLLQGAAPRVLKAKLSGYLLASEIDGMRERGLVRADLPLVIIGNSTLAKLYAHSLQQLGIQAKPLQGDGLTLAGLISAYQELGLCVN